MGENKKDVVLVTEIPSCLKTLARLVAREFYQTEDFLIVDMLVRNQCMREKDIENLLKFDLKLLRARMATLKKEKIVQSRLRRETGPDGSAQKMNYYFINYKSLVNVTKYKLDHMRKRIEAQEREKCTNCYKTFTDLEAGELFDPLTAAFYCTLCKQPVVEDASAVPKDSALMLAKFNVQAQQFYDLLRRAEGIILSSELFEPEPSRIFSHVTNECRYCTNAGRNERNGIRPEEATQLGGCSETKIYITVGEDNVKRKEKKERPIWMIESAVGDNGENMTETSRPTTTESTSSDREPRGDIMNLLMAFENNDGSSGYPVIPGEDFDDDMDDNGVGST